MKTILVDAWNTLFTEDGIDQDIFELLEEFPNTKVVVTNADEHQLVQFGIDKSPYSVFTLKHNPDKIDPIYFLKFLEEFGLNHEQVVYFEHNIEAVKSAQSVGIETFHYDKDQKDLAELKQFLCDNV